MTIYDAPTVTYDDASYDYSGLFIGVIVSWAVVVLSSVMVESASRVANNALWRTVAAGCGYFLADFALVLDGAPISSVTQYAGSYSTDGTHPNAAGQAAVAPILADALKSAAGLL